MEHWNLLLMQIKEKNFVQKNMIRLKMLMKLQNLLEMKQLPILCFKEV